MSLKGWLLGKVHGSPPGTAQPGGHRAAPSLHGDAGKTEPTLDAADGARGAHRFLGPYAPLVAAIRDELEQFAESQLRLHLAIAERDRYVLMSIEVACAADDGHAALLRRFTAEFTPEQIKRFLARDIIAGLRNASAIDLSQFAGLNVEAAPGAEDPYEALIAELRTTPPDAAAHPFDVTLVGRWVQTDAPLPAGGQLRSRDERGAPSGPTPLATRVLALDLEDGRGARRVELAPLVPGRRYAIGKDAACDVVVEGLYASRRHAEIWIEGERCWVADTGSTNGIRVETPGGTSRSGPGGGDRATPLEVPAGATIVLSAQAQGVAMHYPKLTLQGAPAPQVPTRITDAGERPTPATPLAPMRRNAASLRLSARMASGVREIDLAACPLPFGIGRSRNQSLVIDAAHADVSGQHVEIVAVDEGGASVVVHGDNGVTVDGVAHAAGARFVWRRGETMHLGRADANAPACSVSLAGA